MSTGARAVSTDETTERIRFASLDAANRFRDEYPSALAESDTRREKTITLRADVDEDIASLAGMKAEISRADEHKTYGQETLTDAEKRKLDRTHDNWEWTQHGFEAMSAKSALLAEGAAAGDWLNYYEPGEGAAGALRNLAAAKERQSQEGTANALRGHRIDSDPDPGELGQQLERAVGEREQWLRSEVREQVETYGAESVRAVLDGRAGEVSDDCAQRVSAVMQSETAEKLRRIVDDVAPASGEADTAADPDESNPDVDPEPEPDTAAESDQEPTGETETAVEITDRSIARTTGSVIASGAVGLVRLLLATLAWVAPRAASSAKAGAYWGGRALTVGARLFARGVWWAAKLAAAVMLAFLSGLAAGARTEVSA